MIYPSSTLPLYSWQQHNKKFGQDDPLLPGLFYVQYPGVLPSIFFSDLQHFLDKHYGQRVYDGQHATPDTGQTYFNLLKQQWLDFRDDIKYYYGLDTTLKYDRILLHYCVDMYLSAYPTFDPDPRTVLPTIYTYLYSGRYWVERITLKCKYFHDDLSPCYDRVRLVKGDYYCSGHVLKALNENNPYIPFDQYESIQPTWIR